MNCKELTTFLQKVLDKRELIYDPQDEDIEDTQELVDEIGNTAEKCDSYNRNIELRVNLAKQSELKYVGDFYSGWALAYTKNSIPVFVNRKGELLKDEDGKELSFPVADRFSEGIAAVRVANDLRFIKADGTFLKGTYKPSERGIKAHRFSEGHAVVITDDGENLIDKEGNIVLNRSWSKIEPVSCGFARVKDTFSHFIRPDESWLDPNSSVAEFRFGTDFVDGCAFILAESEGKSKWIMIDTNGTTILDDLNKIDQSNEKRNEFDLSENIDEIDSFKNNWAIFSTATNWFGFLNKEGKRLRDDFKKSLFKDANGFSEGFALVITYNEDNSKNHRFINSEGKYLRGIEGKILEFSWASDFENGLARVILGDLNGPAENIDVFYIDRNGKRIDFEIK